MKYIINKEEMKREWSLDHWYEKFVYIVGLIYCICFSIGFLIGFFGSI